MLDPIVLAYLAGVIDSDGYVSATRSIRKGRVYYGASVGIAGTDRQPHDLAASIFGGRVYCYVPTGTRAHYKPQFHWQRYGESARPFLTQVVPYLRIKRTRALLALELQDVLAEARLAVNDDPCPWAPAERNRRLLLDVLVAEIQAQQGRSGRRRRRPGRELDGRTHDAMPIVGATC
jgi:hypothetical protein